MGERAVTGDEPSRSRSIRLWVFAIGVALALVFSALAYLALKKGRAVTQGRSPTGMPKTEGTATMSNAKDVFEQELRRRKLQFSPPGKDGRYELAVNGLKVSVSLENIVRNYQRDGDPQSIVRFVDQIVKTIAVPPWDAARSLVYFSAERSDLDFGVTIRETISKSVCKVLVLTDLHEGRVTWVTPDMIETWGITKRDVLAAASENMSRLLDGKSPEVEKVAGMNLGMIPVESVFKASVIFSPNFKAFAEHKVGWPILAVLPCRDFIYILAEKDESLLNRMGAVVQKEYRSSGYPITTEILRVSDEGIRAIGKFPE